MNLICKVLHGSRLYSLESPDSDYDYKTISLPTMKDCLLMKATKQSFEGSDEENNIEQESFCLQRFLKLAVNSESIVIDMLHCSDHHIITTSEIFEDLRKNKYRFYTKRMAGSLGFARNMALKYGFRADRLDAAKKLYDILINAQSKGVSRLYQLWDDLPSGEHYYKGIDDRNRNKDNRIFEVAGKKLQSTITIEYALEIVQKLLDSYGNRVKIASEMGGNDLKAFSHSFRVGYLLYHIYKDGTFSYPLPETQFIKDVKYGKLNYVTDKLDTKLNDLIVEVEKLAINSKYPARVDNNFIEDIILKAYNYKE